MIESFPELSFEDAFSKGQILSKKWLIDEAHRVFGEDLGSVFVLAGWYGVLPALMFESGKFKFKNLRSFDIDGSCESIADSLNRDQVLNEWKFKAVTKDINQINYDKETYQVTRANGTQCELVDSPDVIVNTSCEHIENFKDWLDLIPKGKKIILQSNNYFNHPEHVNCVSSLEEFIANSELQKICFSGILELPLYTRFMIIGYT